MSKTKRVILTSIVILISVLIITFPKNTFAQAEPDLNLAVQQTDTIINTPIVKYLLKNPSS